METILIVEDELIIRQQLIKTAKEINNELVIYDTDSAKEALKIANEHDIKAFFVDIQLVDYTGLALAKQLREIHRYQFTPIVFITGMETKELEAYREVHCYDFIIKPYTKETLKDMFIKILVNYMNESIEEEAKFCLQFKEYSQLINYDDIVYVEYSKYRIIIHTIHEVIKYNIMPLRKFVRSLPTDFVQIHQSYAINKKHVISVGLNSMSIAVDHVEDPLPLGKAYIHQAEEIIDELFR